MYNKLVLIDYNGTIIPNNPSIRPYGLIIESLFGKEIAREFRSPNKARDLLREKDFTKERFGEFFTHFKTSKIYNDFQKLGNPRVVEVLQKFDNLPDDNIGDFVFDEIIYPLMALYNVYIAGVEPFSDFSDFFERTRANGCCLVINSDSPHICLMVELEEYAKMEHFSFLNQLLQQGLVYGCMEESKKSDVGRVQYIIDNLIEGGILKPVLEKISVIGDGESDFQNFSLVKEDMRPRTNLAFTIQNHLMLIEELRSQHEHLQNNEEKLAAIEDKFSKIHGEIESFTQRQVDKRIRVVNGLGDSKIDYLL